MGSNMEIIAIEPVGKHRCKITFDHCEKIVLYHKEADKYHIQEGGSLEGEAYEEILKKILLPRAKKRVLYLLQSMDRTESQLRQKLQEGFYPQEIIEEAITYGKSYLYIDDREYAEKYVQYHIKRKCSRRVAFDLEQKGIAGEYIEAALANISEEQERETMMALIRKKKLNSEEKNPRVILKVKMHLLGKGYTFKMIDDALKQYLK